MIVFPSLGKSRIKNIDAGMNSLKEAVQGDSVTLILEDDMDISRGDLITGINDMPSLSREIRLMICWFNEKPLSTSARYIIRNHANESVCRIKCINFKVNISTMQKEPSDQVMMNDIANIIVLTSKPLYFDPFVKNNITGSFILIDEVTNETIAAGMGD